MQNNVLIDISNSTLKNKNLPQGIQVDKGYSISLIGGNINFDGEGLQAPDGTIELGSVAENETVKLSELQNGQFSSNFENITQLKDI